ncbi:unnamed protein product [Hermetia illucens]|uniref:Kazal-like domain-containing protein n=1 Tax=Hermetia illucens TaxID=343691 RepID=A0A7R8UQ79_HERIL|nr:uncharacterized protein LOC119651834 [Hermetia illucens]CAD7085017.1 unnamed protein product [Hermetia illucens]
MLKLVLVCAFLAAIFAANAVSLCIRDICNNTIPESICVTNGRTTRLFKSECEMRIAECSDREIWEQTSLSDCFSTKGSAIIIDPINLSPEIPDLNINLDLNIQKSCNMDCMDTYDPVCGFDGSSYMVFRNSCDLAYTKCMKSTNYDVVDSNLCNMEPDLTLF